MAFWTEQDVLQYIKENNWRIASIYGEIVSKDKDGYYYENSLCSCGHLTTTGAKRTGCIFCMFGANCPDDNRFVSLKQTHPRQYEYCMGGGAYDENGVWKPTKDGLGLRHCIDVLNSIYGENFIKY